MIDRRWIRDEVAVMASHVMLRLIEEKVYNDSKAVE